MIGEGFIAQAAVRTELKRALGQIVSQPWLENATKKVSSKLKTTR